MFLFYLLGMLVEPFGVLLLACACCIVPWLAMQVVGPRGDKEGAPGPLLRCRSGVVGGSSICRRPVRQRRVTISLIQPHQRPQLATCNGTALQISREEDRDRLPE